ncbi:MAG: hypothetical protein CL920_14570 [Deltaproteobacteria bacterium]|nr:hypothetical protein [Deltaproteobacteria bacterium]MBU49908.1 hypothetical protein [Deltaproteobacteria bacterium]|tara:strand:+ start:2440 stop:2883 length:444 start_codon:yes stop_codon:yes gene_type:complete
MTWMNKETQPLSAEVLLKEQDNLLLPPELTSTWSWYALMLIPLMAFAGFLEEGEDKKKLASSKVRSIKQGQKVQQEKVTTLKRQNAKEKKRAVSAQGAACTVATKAALDGSAIQLSKLTNGRSPSFFVKVKNSGPPTPIQLKSLPAC